MVYWITGRKNSGKTTLAYRIAKQTNGIVVDGDEVREVFPAGYTDEERHDNIMRIAKIAKIFENQDRIVIVSCVSPMREWRNEAQSMFNECIEICMPFGELWEGTEFEEPEKENEMGSWPGPFDAIKSVVEEELKNCCGSPACECKGGI